MATKILMSTKLQMRYVDGDEIVGTYTFSKLDKSATAEKLYGLATSINMLQAYKPPTEIRRLDTYAILS
jgi:hypothetical protein